MDLFQVTLTVATLLCSLVAGFLFAFAVVVMPGIRALEDDGFLRAFQAMDRIIQNRQPIFMAVWIGSVVALLGAAILGFGRLDEVGRALVIAAVVAYLLGVQAPTAGINIPLNNGVQSLAISDMDAASLHEARRAFEPRWNRANAIRTVLAGVTSALLLTLLIRL